MMIFCHDKMVAPELSDEARPNDKLRHFPPNYVPFRYFLSLSCLTYCLPVSKRGQMTPFLYSPEVAVD